jgi:hypothetical protein
MGTQRLFSHTHKKKLLILSIWLSLIFMWNLHWSDKHQLKSTHSNELPTQQKHDRFPLWHFFPHSNHPQIAWLMCLWTNIHVGLMFTCFLSAEERVRWNQCREEIFHWAKLGCLTNQGLTIQPRFINVIHLVQTHRNTCHSFSSLFVCVCLLLSTNLPNTQAKQTCPINKSDHIIRPMMAQLNCNSIRWLSHKTLPILSLKS